MKLKIDKKSVGRRIKILRNIDGYTLEEFGKKYNTSKSIVYRWENGTALPNAERLSSIANDYNLSINEIIYGSVFELLLNNISTMLKDFATDDFYKTNINNTNELVYKYSDILEARNMLDLNKLDLIISNIKNIIALDEQGKNTDFSSKLSQIREKIIDFDSYNLSNVDDLELEILTQELECIENIINRLKIKISIIKK